MSTYLMNVAICRTLIVQAIVAVAILVVGAGCRSSLLPSPTPSTVTTPVEAKAQSCLDTIELNALSEAKFLDAINRCATVDSKTINKNQLSAGQGTVFVWQTRVGFKGIAYAIAGRIARFGFIVSRGLSIAQILQDFGTPEYVFREEVFNPDKCIAAITLSYPSKGADFGLLQEYPCGQDIKADPSLSMIGYTFYLPGTLDRVLRDAYLMDETVAKRALSIAKEWKGYESILRTASQ